MGMLLLCSLLAWVTVVVGFRSPKRHDRGGDGECHEFLLIGNFGSRNSQQADVAEGLAKVASDNNPTAIFAMGDNIYYGNGEMEMMEKTWYDYYPKKHSSLRRPWYGMAGEHDWEPDARLQVEFVNHSKNQGGHWNMPDLYYKKSFTTGSGTTIDFFIIDSSQYMGERAVVKQLGDEAQNRHKDWLDEELTKSSADWKVVLGHHPPYYWSLRSETVAKRNHSGLLDVLQKHNVPLYGSAHMHYLNIVKGSGGIRNVVSGGGSTRGASGTDCQEDPTQYENNLAYCEGLGFAGVKFCGKSEAEISLYDNRGSRKWLEKSPNVNSMSMSELNLDLLSEENISMS